MLLISLLISSALAFAMFGLRSFPGVGIFALCYGFWSGACQSIELFIHRLKRVKIL